jgi:osmotically-inducible protein OsmY
MSRIYRKSDPDEGEFGGPIYSGGVYSSRSYGSGAEYYSVTGMYDNPLLSRDDRKSHRGKGPRGYTRTDERIREEVCERLGAHPLIDATQMDVHVQNAEVTLSGEIYDRRMKYLAEDVAEDVSGVKDVHCNLRISRSA